MEPVDSPSCAERDWSNWIVTVAGVVLLETEMVKNEDELVIAKGSAEGDDVTENVAFGIDVPFTTSTLIWSVA
jgi:hypothetical protein